MQFEVEQATVLGRPALRIRGELDMTTAPQLAEAADALLAGRPPAVVVDLTGTTFMDSSGARQLVRLARRATLDGVSLQVVCPAANRPVRLVMDLLELQAVVPLVESATSAQAEPGP